MIKKSNITNVHLHINLGTELLIEFQDLNTRIKGRLAGMEGSSYLIIKFSSKDLPVEPEELKNYSIIIRYLFKGSVYGFRSSVLNAISIPSALLFVTYPELIEGFNFRANPRFECILPAEATFGSKTFETVIVDISQDGCRCVIKTDSLDKDALYCAIDLEKTAYIGIMLPGADRRIYLKAAIRNLNKDDDRVIFGARFESMPDVVKSGLDSFISLISSIDGHL